MAKTILDTSALVGLYNPADAHHKRAKQRLREQHEIVLLDYVFDELLNVLSRRLDKNEAKEGGEALLKSPAQLAFTTAQDFTNAWQTYTEDNTYSFTDCVILAHMRRTGNTTILTFDTEFENETDIDVVN